MAYQVLARKYRPQRFSDVAGQEHVTRTLLNALAQGRIAHGYIFSGHRGIGKTTIARILAMALNCRTAAGTPGRPSPEPCGVCVSCEEIRAGNSVDMLEIDAATNRGIDEIRELRDAARYSPARDRYKIILLDEAHQITDAAFNALLKTLEEPPDHIVFMMATTQPEDIPQTIRSRCQHFSFHAVKFDNILGQLRQIVETEVVLAEENALALLAEAGDGSMRDALSIMDQAIASAALVEGKAMLKEDQIRELMGTVPNPVFEQMLTDVHGNQSAAVIEQINRLIDAGNSPSQLARQMVRYLRNALMAKLGGESTDLLQISIDERARAARSAALFSEEDLTRFLQVMLRTFDELNYRQEQRFHLELGLMKLVHLQRLIPLEQLLSSLPGSPGPAPAPPRQPPPRAASGSGTGSKASPAASGGSNSRTVTGAGPAALISPRADELPRPSLVTSSASIERSSTEEADVSQLAAPVVAAAAVAERSTAAVESNELPSMPDPLAILPVEVREVERDPAPASTPDEISPRSLPSDSIDLDRAREAVASALDGSGHNTAAALLSAGRWSVQDDGSLQAEVGIKKTMLGLTMNAEAWKIVREALSGIGVKQKMTVIPGEGSGNTSGAPRPPISGSIQALALENPLVRQAQEIFRAEVRSVVDLRENSPEVSRHNR
ncbi:MAG TPA: DNA polymerase III subunit gamma/tau [Acidobacteriaceae bacterium]|nr:DNA polymerase III subunit gamma/tau [Acidobacteriaceae bacterium]